MWLVDAYGRSSKLLAENATDNEFGWAIMIGHERYLSVIFAW
jgi:hypothetical protein